MKISLLIPVTSNRRSFSKLEDSPLISILLNSFLKYKEEEFEYTFYIGYDKGDRFYTLNKKEIIEHFKSKGVDIVYKEYHNPQRSPVFIWNKLFEDAYNNGEDYFYQIGDDIEIKSKWSSRFVDILNPDSMGVTGPLDTNNSNLLTQSFVTRKHMELFGYYFPHEFKNWYCDNWIQDTYKGCDKLFKLEDVIVQNKGGDARYVINKSPLQILGRKVEESISKINDHIPSKVNVYYNYYIPKNDKRKEELNFCINKIVNSKKVDNIYFISSIKDYEDYGNKSDKIKFIDYGKRPTFRYIFDLIGTMSDTNDYNISLNSDCYIEESSYNLLNHLGNNDAWSLSRWDILNDDNMDIKHFNYNLSQDCWIIKGKPKKLENIDFFFGKPGCDNRITFELKESGYNLFDPSKDFKVIHYHLTNDRDYTERDRVNGNYLGLNPIKINEIGLRNEEKLLASENGRVLGKRNKKKPSNPNVGGYVKNPGLNRVRKKHWKLRRNK